MDITAKKFAFSEDVIDIQKITRTPEKAFKYCAKEINVDFTGKFDSFRIILSDGLFNLSMEQPNLSHKPTVAAPNTNLI